MFVWLVTRIAHAVSPLNPKRKLSIAVIFIVFLLPLIALSSIHYQLTSKNLTELSLARRQAIAMSIAIALQERIDRLVETGTAFSIHPQLRENIEQQQWQEALAILQIFHQLADEPFVDRIFLADPEGTLKVGLPETGTEEQNFASRDWYQGVLAEGKPYLSEVYQRAVEPTYNVVALAIPVATENNALAAILVLQIRLDNFLDWSSTITVGERGSVYVVDQRGIIVSHPNLPLQNSIVDFSSLSAVQKVIQGERGIEITYNPMQRQEEVLAYEPIRKFNWGVVVQQPTETVFAERNQELTRLNSIFFIVVLLYAFLVYLLLRAIAHYQDHHDIPSP